jgi:hypothetical protein
MIQKLSDKKIWLVLGILALIVATGCGRRGGNTVNCTSYGDIGQFSLTMNRTTGKVELIIDPTQVTYPGDEVGIALFSGQSPYLLQDPAYIYERTQLSYTVSENVLVNYNKLVIAVDNYNFAICDASGVSLR